MNRTIAALAVLALAGCGNYSTEDLRFLAALPKRAQLQVAVPAQAGTAGAATVCANGSAEVWLSAKQTSDGLNAGVDFLVNLIDTVRRYPPTWREPDARGWGPFPSDKHPGREIQIVIRRSYPDGPEGRPVHDYRFQARVVGTQTFTDLIWGSFEGASALRGTGSVALDFEAFWALGMNDDASAPHGTMQIAYDRASDPVTIDLQLTSDGFGVVRFDYAFAGYADGRGAFDYAFRNAGGDLLVVTTGYDAASAGRAAVVFTPAGGSASGSFSECWDPAACLSFVADPGNWSGACGSGATSCYIGVMASCVAVPTSPF